MTRNMDVDTGTRDKFKMTWAYLKRYTYILEIKESSNTTMWNMGGGLNDARFYIAIWLNFFFQFVIIEKGECLEKA